MYDLVIGNPPYIRYQYFDKKQQLEAQKIFKRADLSYSKLTNAWVSFVIGSSLMLKKIGKIGFVLPAEILQVSYAQTLRKFLAGFYNKINIISFKKLVFQQIQQEVVLLLCEKNDTNLHLIEHIELEDINSLKTINLSLFKAPSKRIDFRSNKWTFYFLTQKEIDFLETITSQGVIPTIGDYAEVEVGITTGANLFFTVPKSTVKDYDLHDYALPLVGRSVQVRSLKFTKVDWTSNVDSEARAYLLVFPTLDCIKKNKKAMSYLEYGKKNNIHSGYKCRIRDEWQIVPSVWIPEVLFIRRNNVYPKLIINEARAYTTDTMHRLKIKDGVDKRALAAGFYNSLSFAFSEISGRSYGGGVLELMPSEVENICLPYHENNVELLYDIDYMMRKDIKIREILKFTNSKILKNGFGLSISDIDIADKIWQKLSLRRLNRTRQN